MMPLAAAAEKSQPSRVRLQYASFDPTVAVPQVPEILRATPDNELFLVQFHSTPLEADREQIRGWGGVVERFLTDNTHVIRMTPQVREQVSAMPQVRWVGAYEPAYRLSEDARQEILSGARGSLRYSIEVMRVGMAQQQAVADAVIAMGGILETFTPDQYRLEVTVTPEQLLRIVQRNEINYIDPWYGPGGTDMNLIRQTGGAVPLLSGAGFLGQGVRGEIFDTETQSNHPQWNGQIPLVHGTNGSSGFHGSACYGINFATGTGNASATGLLPQREQGIFFWYTRVSQFTAGQPTRLAMNMEATDPNGPYRSAYQTSSVGSPQITTYTTISAEVDDYLFRVDYLSCQSQSNTGNRSSRPQAWAKNIVAVGGLDLRETITREDDIKASGASIGPANDFRVKPDLSHSYSNINTTNNSSGYTQFGGTSGATPITAGHFGLLHQMWHEGVWSGHGGAASVFLSRPKSTTAKAMMINGAYRYPLNQTSTGAPFTNNMYRAYIGWGIADLTKLYNDREKFFIVNADDPLTQGQSRAYQLEVAAGEPEFRTTMIYPDPQGNPAAAQQRINDLSLKVTSPTGTVYWGNNGMVPTAISGAGQLIHSNWTTPGGAANTYDTVENVFVQNPEAGVWTVEVIASQIVQDGYLETAALDAVYSLVVSNVTKGQPCYANCDGSTTEPILNVADFTCFLAKFAANDPYANCDGSTTVPVLNVADFTCFLGKFAAGCP
jgi:serine protease AprX